ncbi:phagocyte signaling-impaired protein [Chrysoperla carnea]|uniref:phagocyte signaling-impaired protein n=1 Tax=Chrysoperla carnea TaxID=189513 RepID=UPI001D095F4C|nr:phagocyte signaling-impaired protein [Chrysoperla carnea]
MAARSHVQGNSVSERRLRPIYDWLDGGHNKKALQEADKVLRKTANLQCARALKALALLRLGKESECTAILDVLAAEKPSDDPTLQAMTICYRELNQYSRVCDLYETAVRQDPTNEELHTHLFMSYVRVLDYKQQQQAAMTLYKLKPKNPYYFWAIMSVVLQATRNPSNDKKKADLLLSLAERMVDKLLNENRIEAEQELQLYLMILKFQNKNEEALKLLESPLGSKLLTGASTHAKIPFLINLKRWRHLNTLCSKILTENSDLWDIWKYYLQSVFELMKLKNSDIKIENHVGDSLTPDDTPEKCHDFICTLLECSDSGRKVRGPWLARLELYIMMEEHNCNPNELLGDYLELLVEYFRKFGDKPCCVYDMKIYIKHLPISRRSDLSSKLLKDVGINSTTLPQSKEQMLRHISSLELSRLCGAHENLGKTHLVAFVTALALHYQHGSNTYEELLPTDVGPAASYAILSAHVLYDISVREQSSTPLILAITILENLLNASPANHHAKLLCVRLYHCLGAGYAAEQVYDTLDIKHIQLDSVGYLHCAQLPVVGPLFVNSHLCNSTCTFFSVNYKDTADYLTFSYKFGSFLKLEELLDFRERLNNSSHRYIVFTEKKFLDLITCANLQSVQNLEFNFTNDVSDYNIIRDNRDLKAIVAWDPITLTDEVDKENQTIFEQDKEVIRLRTALYYYILSLLKVSSAKEEERKEALERVQNYKKNYENVLLTIENANHKPITMMRVAGHFPSRLHSQLQVPYRDILEIFVELICSLESPIDDNNLTIVENIVRQAEKIELRIKYVTDDICKKIKEHTNSEDYHLQKRTVTESVLNTIELTCILTFLCASCCNKPSQGKKTKKKGAPTSSATTISQQLKILIKTMKSHIEQFDEALKSWWTTNENTATLTERLNALNLSDCSELTILSKLSYSHTALVNNLHTILKEKLKILNAYS